MPYVMEVDGMAEISEQLTQLGDTAPAVAGQALYDGAGLMADELTKGANTIQTAPFKWASRSRGETRMPSPEEKQIVLDAGVGIAKFKKSGAEVDTSVGYRNAGYAKLAGKTRPIPVIVNSINSGTSFMKKQPFVRRTARAAAAKVTAKMKQTIEAAWNKLLNKGQG